ncbi:MAG: hypothetical protein FIA97_12235 [Methylococcaceae bacterium]|nr:hypothetical protein [Methylococcaceae bacterium]
MTNPLITLYFLAALQWAGNGPPSGTEPRLADDNGDGTISKNLSPMTAAGSHPLARVERQTPLTQDLGFGAARRKATAESSPAFAAENLATEHNGDIADGNSGRATHPNQIDGIPVKKSPGDWLDGDFGK